ncbi:DNA primase [Ponticaulis sp.]|uniref:DNA primase n=1 Tax=Ponticaulis sp. TaxID=2020902 RepID=UPI000B66E57B|nr:DNA primase [Ponticaulis sp.]MAI88931.1 DNA primase [Ponticaulis sp.]OUY01618.1 MAG: DNA primase [Hyphomonadaceae bacterium TMED5]|tara:strand:+ start:50911 stop:52791 length:1881 start_codon:yes stop_codon:yes gene_type:complete
MVGPRFNDSYINELKSRIRISDVVGRKVKLVKKGKEWSGLSPFTAEKTPSFYVNDQKQFFKDFSSGKFGDVITFLQETERLSFSEAVERLAAEAGMELPQDTPQAKAERSRRGRLLDVCEAATKFFEDQLRGPEGAAARAYLEGRGLKPSSWGEYRLGFAPDSWRALQEHLTKTGATQKDMLDAGLIIQPDSGRDPYDRFRGRVIFPIEDTTGKVIAFGGRAMEKDAKPKYLNSPETELFHKGAQLYRYKRAREAAAMADVEGLIVCEGYMDVIALCEAGFGYGVAPLGTALTEDQLSLLWKVGGEPVLCFDGDAAGVRAAHKAIDRALPYLEPGRSLFFTLLPDGLDPDDLIRERGKGAMGEALGGAKPLVDLLWMRELEQGPLDTPERKAGFEQRLDEAVAHISHAGVKKAYGRELHQRLRDYLFQMRRSGSVRSGNDLQRKAIGRKPDLNLNPRGLRILVRLIDSPAMLEAGIERLAAARFPDPVVSGLKDAVFDLFESGEEVDRTGLTSHLRLFGKDKAIQLLQTQPAGTPLNPNSPEGQEWLSALERFCAVDELSHDQQQLRSGAGGDVFEQSCAEEKARLKSEIRDLTRGGDEVHAIETKSGLSRALNAFGEAAAKKWGR